MLLSSLGPRRTRDLNHPSLGYTNMIRFRMFRGPLHLYSGSICLFLVAAQPGAHHGNSLLFRYRARSGGILHAKRTSNHGAVTGKRGQDRSPGPEKGAAIQEEEAAEKGDHVRHREDQGPDHRGQGVAPR